jgi:transcriptional regulator GlxA family with amidase domain
MNRRELLQKSAAVSLAAAVPFSFVSTKASGEANSVKGTSGLNPLKPPVHGPIPVAFLISQGAAIIDFCGPWEVFQDVSIPNHPDQGFHLYTVAEAPEPIEVSGGMKVIPNYTLKTAPQPKVVVIPAQIGDTDAMLDWIRQSAESADVVMSVCTGAYLLAESGLLAG